MVLDDVSGFLNDQVESLLSDKLSEVGIELTPNLNYSERCQYYFSNLENVDGDLLVTVSDCRAKVLGARNLGSHIFQLSDQENSLLLSLSFRDIIDHPGRYLEMETIAEPTVETKVEIREPESSDAESYGRNEHDTRYFFAPSAFNLKQGELYYNTVYFFLHDLQYGVSDHVSMGIETTVIGIPMYLTPKFSIPLGQKSAIAIGDMFLVGTWGTNGLGNLAYGTFSHGGNNGNISLGVGHLYTNENDRTSETSSAVFNFSAMGRTTPYIFFLTENYVMTVNSKRTASYYYDNGITYILNFPGEFPAKYYSRDTRARTETRLIAFPTVSFTVKFGKKF